MKKLNIFVAIANFNWEYCNLVQPLIDIGHEIIHWDWKADGYWQYAQDWVEVKKQEMNDLLLEKVSKAHAEKKLDLFFSYLSDPVVCVETVQAITEFVPTLNFGCNDIHTFERGHIKIAPFFTLNWTTNKAAISNYEFINANIIQTPFGATSAFYCTDSKNIPKMSFDVSFVGQPYGYRLQMFSHLIHAKLGFSISGRVSYKRLIRTILESRVNIGFCGLGNAGFDNKEMKQLRLRDFEVPVIGGLYLTERESFITELFEENKEMLFYSSVEELVDKAVFYSRFKNRKERLSIARAGQEKCLSQYTWTKHFEKVFHRLGVI